MKIQAESELLKFVKGMKMPGKRELTFFAGGIVAVLILIVGVAALGIYTFQWQNSFTAFVSRIVPFAAANVNGHDIRFSTYYDEASRLKVQNFQSAQKSKSQEIKSSDINKQAIGALVNNELIHEYATKKNISVPDSQVDAKSTAIFASQGGRDSSLKILNDKYGMNENAFKSMIRDQLLRQKVEEAISKDPNATASTSTRLAEIKQELAKGEDFTKVASNLSQDASSIAPDGKNFVSISALPKEVQSATTKLKDGEVLSNPVNVSGTYYFVKRIDSTGGNVRVQIITSAPPSIIQWLAQQETDSKVIKYLGQLR